MESERLCPGHEIPNQLFTLAKFLEGGMGVHTPNPDVLCGLVAFGSGFPTTSHSVAL